LRPAKRIKPGKTGLLLIVLLIAGAPIFAQEHGAAPQAGHEAGAPEAAGHEGAGEHGGGQNTDLWKAANFVLLAGILGYFIGKNAGPFFRSRSGEIQKDIKEAAQARAGADARIAAINLSLANLGQEIAALRASASIEQQQQAARLRGEAQADMEKIQHHAAQEIEAAGKTARQELKRYASGLALALAEEKVRARMNPAAQRDLVQGFVSQLAEPRNTPKAPSR
jgi:F-type H+-transporting ATPase subunit b